MCACVCVCESSGTTHGSGMGLKPTLKEQHFCDVPRRCFLLPQLMFGCSSRQQHSWEHLCTQRPGQSLLLSPLTLCCYQAFKAGPAELRNPQLDQEGIQGSLEHLGHGIVLIEKFSAHGDPRSC